MNETVTVIIPVYNTKYEYLEKCILSVMQQSYRDFYILLIDDYSTDADTMKCLDKIEVLYHNQIEIVHLEKNIGISASRNYGIEHAKGEWICFLDHDDYWDKDYLESMINAPGCTEADIIISGFKMLDEADKFIKLFPVKKHAFKSDYYPYSTSAPWNRLIRRHFLIKNHILFPIGCLTEDIAFNLHCNACASNILAVESYGYCNRVNTKSTSRSRLFISMPYRRMPINYLDEMYKNVLSGKKNNRIIDGAMIEEFTLLSCVFCRKSPKEVKEKAAKNSAVIMRKYMHHYILSNIIYLLNVRNRISVKLIQFGFGIAVMMHAEKGYCAVVTKSLSIVQKGNT